MLARLQGAASSCSWTAGLAWLIADAPANARGRLIGSAMGVAIFGAMLGPVIGGIASVTSIEATFGFVACIGLGLAVWAFATSSQHEPSGQPVALLFSALTKPRMLTSVWLVALPSICSARSASCPPPDALRARRGGDQRCLDRRGLVRGDRGAAGRLHLDRRGRILPLLVAAAAASVCFVFFAALDARWWTYAAVIVACSFALGAFWAPSMSMASDEAEVLGLDYAFGFAIINLAWAPSQVAGSVGGGRLADVTSDTVVYLALAVLFTLTLAALWRSASSS